MKATILTVAFGGLLALLGFGLSDWRYWVLVFSGAVLYATGKDAGHSDERRDREPRGA